MKRLAGLIFFIFAFNIIAEMTAGHCHEDCQAGQQEIQEATKASLETTSDVHVCHLGHCAHVALLASQTIPTRTLSANVYLSKSEHPHWRNIAPLLKPPIA